MHVSQACGTEPEKLKRIIRGDRWEQDHEEDDHEHDEHDDDHEGEHDDDAQDVVVGILVYTFLDEIFLEILKDLTNKEHLLFNE